VLQELRELKDLIKSLKEKQGEMEKTLARITKQLDTKDFELTKSPHAVSSFPIVHYNSLALNR
jgi:hypothetical protein